MVLHIFFTSWDRLPTLLVLYPSKPNTNRPLLIIISLAKERDVTIVGSIITGNFLVDLLIQSESAIIESFDSFYF